MNFLKSTEALKIEVNDLATFLKEDKKNLYPKWFNDDIGDCIFKKNIIICGSTSDAEIRILVNNFNVIAIVDDILLKKCDWLYGIPLISTSQWIDKVRSDREIISIILVATLKAYSHFTKQAIQHSIIHLTPIQIINIINNRKIITPSDGLFFRYGIGYFEFTLNNIEKLIDQANIFVDDYSKLSYLNMLIYKLTLNPYYLENTAVGRGSKYDYNNYLFDRSYLNLSDNEVYIDAGAFTGDSLECFLFAVKGKFKHIYTFEPDSKNNIEINKRIAILQQFYLKPLSKSISIIESGIWSKEAVLEFSTSRDHDLGGHVIEAGMIKYGDGSQLTQINVTSIDVSTDQDATFIKYEVEGSELEGLIGAQNTIVKNKPKLAVALYHKPEDILILPKHIENLDMNYKIGFRQHDPYKPDATYCYCY
jgi:FkbM family methyltransferase